MTSPGQEWRQSDDAYLSAIYLASFLRSGRRLAHVQANLSLGPGEQAYYGTGFAAYVFTAANVSYQTEWVAMFDSPAWLAVSLAGSAMYNAYQRNQAAAMAAPQWRLADQGIVHITSQRICLQGNLHWIDIPLSAIRAIDALPDGVVIHRSGEPPLKISTLAVAYIYVLIVFLVHGRVVDLPIPGEFAERARIAGRAILPAYPE